MTRFRRNHGGRVKLPPAEVLELPLDRAHVAAIDALAKNSRCGRSTYLRQLLLNEMERAFEQAFRIRLGEFMQVYEAGPIKSARRDVASL